ADAQIGLETEGLPPETRKAIVEALPRARVRDCSNMLRLIRMVKTPDEISRLTRAAEIGEQAILTSLALARPGCPMADLIQRYRAEVGASGADVDHFAFGVRGLGIATEPDGVLASDDVLYVDFGCIYQRCYADSGMTLTVSELSAPLLEKYGALRECVIAGVETIRPGVKASVVSAAMWQTLSSHGITASFPHGHGLGLEVRDYPIIVADNGLRIRDGCVDVPSDLPLEADMVVNLEASIFMPGVGSLHIERSFVVTPAGSRSLVPQDRTQPVQPAM
ncbi:MAG: aminopeptidase P family protein, partial [Candidatus Latescibacteria bacterium]|nr:aminopeptidase P family protein [Candidatus Latescibacterota bacterium]